MPREQPRLSLYSGKCEMISVQCKNASEAIRIALRQQTMVTQTFFKFVLSAFFACLQAPLLFC